ncbi:unnamed protein product, partial [Vitis vinifera]|uniref:Uncharacterized protein n=1 Tax=Vitis vinifera TaxID=29760 RepID=D7U9H5_VITVI
MAQGVRMLNKHYLFPAPPNANADNFVLWAFQKHLNSTTMPTQRY